MKIQPNKYIQRIAKSAVLFVSSTLRFILHKKLSLSAIAGVGVKSRSGHKAEIILGFGNGSIRTEVDICV
jgi:hypothetical protein